tara:strand:- start:6280 stop:6831 length:552 start_codon:yes stop_codon:yes gene_type:complete
MRKIMFLVLSVVLSLPLAVGGAQATELEEFLPRKGHGMMSGANVDAIREQFSALKMRTQAAEERSQALVSEKNSLVDLMSTRQKQFLLLSTVTGVAGFFTGYYFGYDAGYQMGYSTALGAAAPVMCEVAKPIIQTVYRNITQFVCQNVTETIYLQPDQIILNPQPLLTVRRSILGSLWNRLVG